jgi:hypothetical protein
MQNQKVTLINMYTGHFAAAIALKARVPKAPSWALFVGAGLLDYIWSVFIVLKWEIWTKKLVLIPWSHSLLMSIVWAALFGMLFYKRGKNVVIAIALSVFLHFVFDFFVHPAHLQIAPGINAMFGLNLGQEMFTKGWFLELLIIVGCSSYYLISAAKQTQYGKYSFGVCSIILGLHIVRGILNM